MSELLSPTKPAQSHNASPAKLPATDSVPRRRQTPRQELARLRQQKETLAAKEAKLVAKVAEEDRALLAKQGRMIYLSFVEELHPGERDLQVNPLLGKMTEDKRVSVEAWLASLAK